MKTITFMGGTLNALRAFPTEARQAAGFQLDRVQRGMDPSDWKPMANIGIGVKEIRLKEEAGIFRVIYVARFAERIYVLHAFQKKTARTEQRDIELARKHYREVANDQHL